MFTMQQGYYRQPSVYKDQVVFVSEDDLWKVSLSGGKAERLTSNLNIISYPYFSPDGSWIAFLGNEDGNEDVYKMPANGGIPERLTYSFSFRGNISGWSKDGNHVIYSSCFQQPFLKSSILHKVHKKGGLPENLKLGHGKHISYGSKNRSVIGRNTLGIERWKRYRGGTAGVLWIDNIGNGKYKEWAGVKGNLANPMWIGERIYFISDHEGIANLYSVNPSGKDLKRHTSHKEYFCKDASSDGKTIVYSAGADLYKFDIKKNENSLIQIEYNSPKVQLQPKYIDAQKYLQHFDIHPKGHSLLINSRGKTFETANWEGTVHALTSTDGIRQRLCTYLPSGDGFILVTDENGTEQIEIHDRKSRKIKIIDGLNYGRATALKVSPDQNYIALSNHKAELILVDLNKKSTKIIAKSAQWLIKGFNWSRDSKWIAYGKLTANNSGNISVYSITKQQSKVITESDFLDFNPSFSPCGNYIYFLSNRVYNPVYDSIYFDLNFPQTAKPYCIVLNKEACNPFLPQPFTPGEEFNMKAFQHSKKVNTVKIDFNDIAQRIVEMPISEGIFEDIAVTDDYIISLSRNITGALDRNIFSDETTGDGILKIWDIKRAEEKSNC